MVLLSYNWSLQHFVCFPHSGYKSCHLPIAPVPHCTLMFELRVLGIEGLILKMCSEFGAVPPLTSFAYSLSDSKCKTESNLL